MISAAIQKRSSGDWRRFPNICTHKTHGTRTDIIRYIPIHVDVVAGDEAALAEGAGSQKISGFDEIRRAAAVRGAGERAAERIAMRTQRRTDAFVGAAVD